MRIVVIGSDSFIAKKFIKLVHDKVDSLVGISRINSGLEYDSFYPDFTTIPETIFKGADVVFNFAAIVHRPDIKEESVYDDINFHLAVLNAQKAKNAGIGLFIQMSTISVYGNSQYIDENTVCCPNTFYGSSKLKADDGLLNLQSDAFKVAIVRPPMVYGAKGAPGNMHRLIKMVKLNIPLPLRNSVNTRDFIHIKNLVQYLDIIATKSLSGVFIITDHQPVSTSQLIITISKCLNQREKLYKMPSFLEFFFRRIFRSEYNKLFGGLSIQTNFPYENEIIRYTVEDGIKEMVS